MIPFIAQVAGDFLERGKKLFYFPMFIYNDSGDDRGPLSPTFETDFWTFEMSGKMPKSQNLELNRKPKKGAAILAWRMNVS